MPSDHERIGAMAAEWREAELELADAGEELKSALPGIARQHVYTRLLAGQRRCTALVHQWLADAFHLARIVEPRVVLSLDVDGVLEEESGGFSATDVMGAAALRLLQMGGVAVLLNTGRSLVEVQDRVEQFSLLGGVASFGAAAWDGVYSRTFYLLSDRGSDQLAKLRELLRADAGLIQDLSHTESVRVSRVVDGARMPISGSAARALLDRHGLTELSFWVAPGHDDFVDRRVDKAIGLTRLRQALGLDHLPLAAIGDGACDIPTLRQASRAFVPAATLPSYVPGRRQRLVRSRHLGEGALWDAACHLVPDRSLRRRVTSAVEGLVFPEWFPPSLRRRPPSAGLRLPSWRPRRFFHPN
jgi:3-deoxy-D-manno-octulosonate 8-phosphate phosphatase KdsC-like HAD superfamily phosphatase